MYELLRTQYFIQIDHKNPLLLWYLFFLIYCDENLIFSSLHHYTHIVSVGLTFSCVWRIGRHGGDYEHDDQPTAAVREAHAYITSASSTSAAIEHKVVQPAPQSSSSSATLAANAVNQRIAKPLCWMVSSLAPVSVIGRYVRRWALFLWVYEYVSM